MRHKSAQTWQSLLFGCNLTDARELDVGINPNDDDDIICEDTRHVAITVAPNLLDILNQLSPFYVFSVVVGRVDIRLMFACAS